MLSRFRIAALFTALISLVSLGPSMALSQSPTDGTSPAGPQQKPAVVLLHGLARRAGSMQKMAEALENAGFQVCNVDYPSRQHSIAKLTQDYVLPSIRACFPDPQTPLNFVTHSMGGIITRQLAATQAIEHFARVVMLGPPNGGSEVVDKLGDWQLFQAMNGPAGSELSTAADALPQQLGTPEFEFGIIAGNFSINPLLSLLIPGDNDGKVSIRHARLTGMQDFLVMPVSHPFLMKNMNVIEQTLQFLKTGRFAH